MNRLASMNHHFRYFLAGLIFGLAFLPNVATAAKKTHGNRMIEAYFRAETARVADANRHMLDVRSLDEWKAKQKVLRAQLFDMLGLDPLPPKTDLKATVTGTLEREGIVVEKLHFQSRPGLYVTANFYRPAKVEKPLPTILYLCGHKKMKEGDISYGNKTSYQHHGAWFAKHGYVCLTVDSLELGEIEGIHQGTKKYDRWWWNNRGYTPAGVEAWNNLRAIDYLETRPEVDTKRIGATGRSGGGAYTWVIAALDERIVAAAPVAGITDLENHVVDGVLRRHCDCNFFINRYQWDFPTVASLVAPRRLLICNTDRDPIFLLDGVLRIFNKTCAVYRLYKGKEENVELVVTPGKHADSPLLQTSVFAWFNEHLQGDTRPIDDSVKPLFTPEELRVFKTLPKDQINTTIDETFVAKADRYASGDAPTVTKTLREKVFCGWPDRPGELDVKKIDQKIKDGQLVTTYEYTSQEHIRLPLYVVGPVKPGPIDSVDVRIISEPEWKSLHVDLLQEKPSAKGSGTVTKNVAKNATIQVYVPIRGIGPTRWSGKKQELVDIERRFMLLGQTLDGMRIWDVRRALQAVREIFKTHDYDKSPQISTTLSGEGVFGMIACYAALFEPSITAIHLSEPIDTAIQKHSPILLNVDRVPHVDRLLRNENIRKNP